MAIDKKKLTTIYIVGGIALAATAAYLIFKKDPDAGPPTPIDVDPNLAYLNKVKELQKLIGVNPDGIIGDKTKAALLKYKVTTTEPISSKNIDAVLVRARKNISGISTEQARYAKGLEIFTFLKNNAGRVKFTVDANISVYEKDFLGRFIKTDKVFRFDAGYSFKPLYMINSMPGNNFGTGFSPGFMMFEITRPLDFNYLFKTAPKFFIGPISAFSITAIK